MGFWEIDKGLQRDRIARLRRQAERYRRMATTLEKAANDPRTSLKKAASLLEKAKTLEAEAARARH